LEIDNGFEMKHDTSNNCFVFSRHGRTIAYVYDNSLAKLNGMHQGDFKLGMVSAGKQYFKAPIAMYMEKMSTDDMYLTLTVIAACHDRMIRNAMLDISGSDSMSGY